MPDRPALPLTVRGGVATVDLVVTLADVVIPGDDERPEGITLGHLVAAAIVARAMPGLDMPGLDDLRITCARMIEEHAAARAREIIDDVLTTSRSRLPFTRRADLTLAQMIQDEVGRQLADPDQRATARGRSPVPVIEAVVETAVTEELRKLTATQVRQVVGRVLADIGGR